MSKPTEADIAKAREIVRNCNWRSLSDYELQRAHFENLSLLIAQALADERREAEDRTAVELQTVHELRWMRARMRGEK